MAMLTPGQIKGYQFQSAGRGAYKADEVDAFLAQVVECYEQSFKENGELLQKLKILAKRLNEYREEESKVSKVLLNAQTFIDKMIEEAKKEAKEIVSEAEDRAKNVDSITNAKIKVMVDEVEGKMRLAYEKAMTKAKETRDLANKESELLVLEAKQKAEKIISDAEATASALISDATKDAEKEAITLKEEIEREKELLDSLKETSKQFKTELVVLYERQLKSVEQMPDYALDKDLEEKVKKIVEEEKTETEPDVAETPVNNEAVDKMMETFVESEDDYFDADDLIREYATGDTEEDSGFSFDFGFEENKETAEENTEVDVEDVFSFNLEETDTEEIEETVEDTFKEVSEEITEEIKEDIPEEGFSFEFDEEEPADEYEDIFSDSGEGDGFRFTSEDFEDIKNSEEASFDFRTEDVDLFSEEAVTEDVPVSKPERSRPFDIGFAENNAVQVEKDESLFLDTDDEIETEETGFKFFDDIDMTDEEDEDEEIDANDIFVSTDDDEDDDSDGFGFLKNIFGKN